MYQTILVPLDGSILAERALPYARALARACGARILLLRAATGPVDVRSAPPRERSDNGAARQSIGRERASGPSSPDAGPRTFRLRRHEDERADGDCRAYLEAVAGRLGESIMVDIAMPLGDAVDVILAEIAQRKIDLVVMSTHGRPGIGRLVYGSVADEVVRRADVPVLLIPAGCRQAWPEDRPPRILIPLDGSARAEEVLAPIRESFKPLRPEILLVRAVCPPRYSYGDASRFLERNPEAQAAAARAYLDGVAHGLESVTPTVETCLRLGDPAAVIADLAQEWHADVIALATHGRSGLSRLVTGSVASALVRHGKTPVFIVRPNAI